MMTQQQAITEVARRVGARPEWLDALINFETGGTYSTTIKNPHSSARGLIQLTDAPARDLGFRDSLDAVSRYPGFTAQMFNVVLPYLEMQKKRYGPLNTRQRLYMAVFYPAYMSEPPDTAFSSGIREANPGIDTVQDYMDYVDARVDHGGLLLKKAAPALGAAIIALGIAGTVYWLQTRK